MIVQFDPDRRRRPIVVPRSEDIVRLFKQWSQRLSEIFGFRRRCHDLEPGRRDRAESGEVVEQIERVLVPEVVGVQRERRLEVCTPLGHPAEA